MEELFILIAIADSSISGGGLVAIAVILAFIVLAISLWLFRSNLQFRRIMMARRRVVKRCPNCNTVMQPDASFCPNCGQQVPVVTTSTQ